MLKRSIRNNAELSIRLLDSLNIKWEIIPTSKHARLIYQVNGQKFCHYMSSSSSDSRSGLYNRTFILRNLRKLGVTQ